MFCLASAGHERGSHAFLVDALSEHIRTHLAALARLEEHGYAFGERKVKLLATERFTTHAQRVAAMIGDAMVIHAPLEHDYYDGMRFNIFVRTRSGDEIPFIDGGAFDWLRKLMSNQKMVFVASGMGAQLAAYLFHGLRPAP
jgi:hypothetical protein